MNSEVINYSNLNEKQKEMTTAIVADANEDDFVLVNAKVIKEEAKRVESAKVAPIVSVPVTAASQPITSTDANLLDEFIRNKTFHGSCQKQASFLVNEIDEQIAAKQSLYKLNTLRYGSLIVLAGLAITFFLVSIIGDNDEHRSVFYWRMWLLCTLILLLMSQIMFYVHERHSYRKNAVIILNPKH